MGSPEKKKKKKKKKSAIAIGGRDKKKKSTIAMGSRDKRKKKKTRKHKQSRPSTTYRHRNRNWQLEELKDMRMLTSTDEPFRLSAAEIGHIARLVIERETPTPITYQRWDEYAISFYLKMCSCFDVHYQHLEDTPDYLCQKSKNVNHRYASALNWVDNHEITIIQHFKARQTEPGHAPHDEEPFYYSSGTYTKFIEDNCRIPILKWPFKMGSYPPGTDTRFIKDKSIIPILKWPYKMGSYSRETQPDRIPYHLYVLVKEAVDIMNKSNDLTDLKIVENKIRFFRIYFHSHLPTHWNYMRNKASSLVAAGYYTKDEHRSLMAGYSLSRDWAYSKNYEENTRLYPHQILDTMSIIHSRKTPSFWGMRWEVISLYCKLCSCFGIDFHCLEAASEDDVYLMNVGRNC